jgi:amino acid transporter
MMEDENETTILFRGTDYQPARSWRTWLIGRPLPTADDPPLEMPVVTVLTPFPILRAFFSGTAALTGVEAISNGTTAFREPRSRNAGITLLWMGGILGALFLSITYLTGPIGASPSEAETVISQLARSVFGGQGVLYLGVIVATTLILIMATNASFAGLERCSRRQVLPSPGTLRSTSSRRPHSFFIAFSQALARMGSNLTHWLGSP